LASSAEARHGSSSTDSTNRHVPGSSHWLGGIGIEIRFGRTPTCSSASSAGELPGQLAVLAAASRKAPRTALGWVASRIQMTVAVSHVDEAPAGDRGCLGLILLATSSSAHGCPGSGATTERTRLLSDDQRRRQIAATGQYVESRLPGTRPGVRAFAPHPWRPMASNGLTAVFSVAASLFLALILRRLGVRGTSWGRPRSPSLPSSTSAARGPSTTSGPSRSYLERRT